MSENPIIFKQMSAVMRDIDAIGKDRTNQMQGFKFRGIDDLYNTIHGVLGKHGVFSVPEILSSSSKEYQTKNGGVQIERILRIKYTFYAEDGSSIVSIVEGEARDTGDKTTNKCMSIAHKYCLLQIFCIPTEDKEDDRKDPDFVDPPHIKPKEEEKKAKAAPPLPEWLMTCIRKLTDLRMELKVEQPEIVKILESKYQGKKASQLTQTEFTSLYAYLDDTYGEGKRGK